MSTVFPCAIMIMCGRLVRALMNCHDLLMFLTARIRSMSPVLGWIGYGLLPFCSSRRTA